MIPNVPQSVLWTIGITVYTAFLVGFEIVALITEIGIPYVKTRSIPHDDWILPTGIIIVGIINLGIALTDPTLLNVLSRRKIWHIIIDASCQMLGLIGGFGVVRVCRAASFRTL